MSTAGFAYPASPMVEAASWARRFGAYFLDGLLLGIPFVGFMMARMMGVLAEAGLFEQFLALTRVPVKVLSKMIVEVCVRLPATLIGDLPVESLGLTSGVGLLMSGAGVVMLILGALWFRKLCQLEY